jgi:hypothetical protein
MKWLLFWSLSFSLLGGSPVRAISGGVLGLTPEEKAVRDAASIRDPRRREDALRDAIRDGLLSADPAIRDRIFSYLSENTRWLDLKPYADVIEQFAKTDSLHRGLWLLDDNELAKAPRTERLVVYRAAIENGVTRLGRGRPLTRESAMAFAASEGMTEVEPLVAQFSPMVEARWKESFQFQTFPALFQLCGGAQDREDALRLASQRLAAMADKEVKAKMDDDSGFRGAVLQVARDVCAADPFSGNRRNPGCADMKGVIGRQMALELHARKADAESSAIGSASPAEERSDSWLTKLRQHVPDAEIVKR